MKTVRLVLALLVVLLNVAGTQAGKSFSSGVKSASSGVKSFSSSSAKPSSSSFKPSAPSSGSKAFGGSASGTVKAPTSPPAPKVSWGSFFRSGARETESSNQIAASKSANKAPTGYNGGVVSGSQRQPTTSSGKPTTAAKTTDFYKKYESRPVVVYRDSYSPMWNYWLLDQSLDTMALWCYHHQASMDQQRLRDLYAQNAGLEAKIKALEVERGGMRDVSYVPPNVDADVIAAHPGIGLWTFVGSCFGWVIKLALLGAIVWLCYYYAFVYRW